MLRRSSQFVPAAFVAAQHRLHTLAARQGHIKVSALVSDLLGASARRMLATVATGEAHPTALAALGSARLRTTPEQLAVRAGPRRRCPPSTGDCR